jgi:hypothetical protein
MCVEIVSREMAGRTCGTVWHVSQLPAVERWCLGDVSEERQLIRTGTAVLDQLQVIVTLKLRLHNDLHMTKSEKFCCYA